MSISQQLTRLARNVGALNADTNAIFEALRAKGVDVPADAQLSDVAGMLYPAVPSWTRFRTAGVEMLFHESGFTMFVSSRA